MTKRLGRETVNYPMSESGLFLNRESTCVLERVMYATFVRVLWAWLRAAGRGGAICKKEKQKAWRQNGSHNGFMSFPRTQSKQSCLNGIDPFDEITALRYNIFDLDGREEGFHLCASSVCVS